MDGDAWQLKFVALAARSVEFGLVLKYHSARIYSLFSRTEVLRSVEPVVGITSDPWSQYRRADRYVDIDQRFSDVVGHDYPAP